MRVTHASDLYVGGGGGGGADDEEDTYIHVKYQTSQSSILPLFIAIKENIASAIKLCNPNN